MSTKQPSSLNFPFFKLNLLMGLSFPIPEITWKLSIVRAVLSLMAIGLLYNFLPNTSSSVMFSVPILLLNCQFQAPSGYAPGVAGRNLTEYHPPVMPQNPTQLFVGIFGNILEVVWPAIQQWSNEPIYI